MNDVKQKEIIILGACDLFSRFGLEKTTMEDIAKAARKGKSTLYYYFENKEQVFVEVIKREIDFLKVNILHAINAEEDPADQFRQFFYTRLQYLNEKADQYTSIKDEHLKNYAFIEKITDEFTSWEIKTIRAILMKGVKKGTFEINNCDSVAQALFFALKSLEYPWTINLSRKDIEKSVKVLVEILLTGISKA